MSPSPVNTLTLPDMEKYLNPRYNTWSESEHSAEIKPHLIMISHFDLPRCVRQCLRGCSNRHRISRRAAAESRAFIMTGLVRSKERTLCRGKCQTHGGHVWWQSRGTWGQVSLADPRKHDFLKNWKRLFVEKSAEWIVCCKHSDWLHCYQCVHTSFSANLWTSTAL